MIGPRRHHGAWKTKWQYHYSTDNINNGPRLQTFRVGLSNDGTTKTPHGTWKMSDNTTLLLIIQTIYQDYKHLE